MSGDFWIMMAIMVFVLVAQGALWVWVLLQRRRVAPDVPILNWAELVQSARKLAEGYYKRDKGRGW